jgi:hypothetical protein
LDDTEVTRSRLCRAHVRIALIVLVEGANRDLNRAGVSGAWREASSPLSAPPFRGASTSVNVICRARIDPRSRAPRTCQADVPKTAAPALAGIAIALLVAINKTATMTIRRVRIDLSSRWQ